MSLGSGPEGRRGEGGGSEEKEPRKEHSLPPPPAPDHTAWTHALLPPSAPRPAEALPSRSLPLPGRFEKAARPRGNPAVSGPEGALQPSQEPSALRQRSNSKHGAPRSTRQEEPSTWGGGTTSPPCRGAKGPAGSEAPCTHAEGSGHLPAGRWMPLPSSWSWEAGDGARELQRGSAGALAPSGGQRLSLQLPAPSLPLTSESRSAPAPAPGWGLEDCLPPLRLGAPKGTPRATLDSLHVVQGTHPSRTPSSSKNPETLLAKASEPVSRLAIHQRPSAWAPACKEGPPRPCPRGLDGGSLLGAGVPRRRKRLGGRGQEEDAALSREEEHGHGLGRPHQLPPLSTKTRGLPHQRPPPPPDARRQTQSPPASRVGPPSKPRALRPQAAPRALQSSAHPPDHEASNPRWDAGTLPHLRAEAEPPGPTGSEAPRTQRRVPGNLLGLRPDQLPP